jgi:hypothetical protein
MRMNRYLPLFGLTLAACAHAPAVGSNQLPLKRVVVYRNGVGYFERGGEVDGDSVQFQVKTGHIGDFLATLAVIEKGGSSVRSASFPLHVKKNENGEPTPTVSKQTVELALDGREHDLRVGYVSEQPVWRPSYRLVFTDGEPQLQVWGIVQNLSGEDWRNVSLALVAGAPIAFKATLATPVTPARPVVNDQGETIMSVPESETSLARGRAQAPSTPPPPSAAAPMMQPKPMAMPEAKDARPADELDDKAETEAVEGADVGGVVGGVIGGNVNGPSMPRNLSLLASAAVQAGATRYELPNPVTIPDDSESMVLLDARAVPGEEAYLFAPDPGVPDSVNHPFHVARFKNVTPGLFERGPIAIFEKGAFLGQGLLAPLAAGAETTVPFALERGLAIETEQKWEQKDARLARIDAGALTIERDQVLRTTYKLRNGMEKVAKAIIRHPRQPQMRLVDPPKETDDQVGERKALVPVEIAAAGETQLSIEERRANEQGADWLSNEADLAVRSYLADKRADPKVAGPLAKAWELRDQLRKAMENRAKLGSERNILQQAAEQVRASLKSIERNKGAAVEDLRKKLTVKLAELEGRLGDTSNQLVEIDLKANETKVRFDEIIRDLKLAEPLPLI